MVKVVAGIIYRKYHELDLDETIGPLSTGNSDGAGQFRKGIGQLLSNLLPENIRADYEECDLFNIVGGDKGMTMACDLDHVGKRTRARIKTEGGIWIFNVQFTKIDIAQLMGNCGQFAEVDVEVLFNPEDLMDVGEMVKCLDAIKKLGSVPFVTFLQR